MICFFFCLKQVPKCLDCIKKSDINYSFKVYILQISEYLPTALSCKILISVKFPLPVLLICPGDWGTLKKKYFEGITVPNLFEHTTVVLYQQLHSAKQNGSSKLIVRLARCQGSLSTQSWFKLFEGGMGTLTLKPYFIMFMTAFALTLYNLQSHYWSQQLFCWACIRGLTNGQDLKTTMFMSLIQINLMFYKWRQT